MLQGFLERIAEQPHSAALVFGCLIGIVSRTVLDYLELKKMK